MTLGTIFQTTHKRSTPRLAEASRATLHLVSDLDGTWIPRQGGQTEDLSALEQYLENRPDITLTFATGRSLESALQILKTVVGRQPDHLITDVGGALFHAKGSGEWVEDQAYAAWVSDRWDAGTRERLVAEGLPEGVCIQDEVGALRRVPLKVNDPDELLRSAIRLQVMIHRLGLAADVLTSNERYIDILPLDVDKGSPIRFMKRHLGLSAPLLAYGDSENDLGLFKIADVAVLMSDSPLNIQHPRLNGTRVLRSSQPGPKGILEILKIWDSNQEA